MTTTTDPRASSTDPSHAGSRLEIASSGRALAWGLATALVVTAIGAWARVHAALGDPNFDAVHPEGVLRSDPALLYYFVERILEAGGGVPADFHADPRILHPHTVDVPALFPLGVEFVIAWAYRLFGAGTPLHVFCLATTSVFASTTALGVYGLALELAGRVRWALVALVAWATAWASYRTVGFVLMGEDFAWPWFALHLYLFARARRVRTTASIVTCALALVAALATWHAMGFFVAIEAVVLWAWFARTGANPFAVRRGWLALVVLLVASFVVPILASTRAWGSVPMQIAVGLACAAWFARRPRARRVHAIAASVIGAIALHGLAGFVASRSPNALSEYTHVWGLLRAKLEYWGELPADPARLAPEVRMMWQGPFATMDVAEIARELGLAALALVVVLPVAWRAWRRGTGDAGFALVGAATALSLPITWMVGRTILLPGTLVPVAAALAARASFERGWKRSTVVAVAGVLLVQTSTTVEQLRAFASSWYQPPTLRHELRALVDAVPSCIPEGEAVAADFMTSPAILAHTRRPILFQPKWEDRESRERIAELFATFYRGTPADLRRVLLDRYRCRYLVVDRELLGSTKAALYLGGVRTVPAPPSPTPGTAWEAFAGPDTERAEHVEGYHLLWRSPPSIRDEHGQPSDRFRIFALTP